MKTMEELFAEIKANQKLKEEALEALQSGTLADFLKAHDCSASVKEAVRFVKAKAEKSGIPSYILDLL